MKNSKTLSEKLKSYSLFTAGVLASAVAADAQVIYTDVDPDYYGQTHYGESFSIDLNNDGVTDFTIAGHSSSTSYGFTYYWLTVQPAPGNSVANVNGLPEALDSGMVIDSNLTWNAGGNQLLGSYYNGNFRDQSEKFLGARFTFNGEQHYGWVRLSVNYDASSYTVHDYAYEATPDHSIAAGDTGTSACPIPENLSVPNITSSSAKLKWDAVAGAEGYKVRYKVTGDNSWTVKNAVGNSKTLKNLSPNTKYTWEVKTYCTIAPGTSSEWSAKQHFTTGSLRTGDESLQQSSFQVYPNPAEDHATIQFTLPQSSHVCVKVYDLNGKEVGVMLDTELQQGEHSLQLNTNHFPNGVYMVKMISDFGSENQKLIVQ